MTKKPVGFRFDLDLIARLAEHANEAGCSKNDIVEGAVAQHLGMATGPWVCDQCFQPIEKAEDGWVEWREGGRVAIVHHISATPRGEGKDCYPLWAGKCKPSSPLRHFLGTAGIIEMLGAFARDKVVPDALVDAFYRLHVPGYEGARNAAVHESGLVDAKGPIPVTAIIRLIR